MQKSSPKGSRTVFKSPHGYVPLKYKKWYLEHSGYKFDINRYKTYGNGWIAENIIENGYIVEGGENCGEKVKALKAVIFDQKFNRVEREIRNKYPRMRITISRIFDCMQSKTININDQEQFSKDLTG
ncbi:MAG: hypothetical protein ACFFDH_00170 [Promethearchaeota archaeon]